MKNLKRKSSDIYFAADDAHAFLPWIIGVMAGMAALLLCLGLTVSGWVADHSDHYANSFTVNVPASVDHVSDKLPKLLEAIQKVPGVINVSQLPEEKLRAMLKPWLGSSVELDAKSLPLPFVFDATLTPDTVMDYPKLQASLSAIAPGTQVDSHEAWVASFIRFSGALRTVMGALAGLIISGLALMIAFTARASLKLHTRSVNLLHSLGAEDNYITRQFQREAFWLTLRGTVPGCVIAGLAYWSAGRYMEGLHSPAIPTFSIQMPHLALLICLPLACCAIGVIAARISVLKQLQRVL